MTPERHGGGYRVRAGDGRATRLYLTPVAALRAAERGELYTEREYTALTTPQHTGRAGARRKH